MLANKLCLRFCQKFDRYYPVKMIPPKDWTLDYCMIYERRPEKFKLSFFQKTRMTLPSMIYYPYWLMLGHLDYKHIGVACVLGYHIYREILHIILVEDRKVQRLYLNKNGIDWLVVMTKSPIDQYLIPRKVEGLEELQIPNDLTVIKIALSDINYTNYLLQKTDKQLDLPFIEFWKLGLEATINLGEDEREITVDKNYNLREPYNEFLNPFFSKRQVVFKQ